MRAGAPPRARQGVGRAALALTADEVAHGGRADAKQLGDLTLRAPLALVGRNDLAAQVVGVGFHAEYSEPLLLVNSRPNRSNTLKLKWLSRPLILKKVKQKVDHLS